LSVAQADEDFDAVTSSVRVLRGFDGGDWPLGLTREDNLIDMGWHEREFTTHRSFAWIIRDREGQYLGCAYLYPDIAKRGSGRVVTWMCDTPHRIDQLGAFNRVFHDWLVPFLPGGYETAWTSNDQP
jgi:hypothetical protein